MTAPVGPTASASTAPPCPASTSTGRYRTPPRAAAAAVAFARARGCAASAGAVGGASIESIAPLSSPTGRASSSIEATDSTAALSSRAGGPSSPLFSLWCGGSGGAWVQTFVASSPAVQISPRGPTASVVACSVCRPSASSPSPSPAEIWMCPGRISPRAKSSHRAHLSRARKGDDCMSACHRLQTSGTARQRAAVGAICRIMSSISSGSHSVGSTPPSTGWLTRTSTAASISLAVAWIRIISASNRLSSASITRRRFSISTKCAARRRFTARWIAQQCRTSSRLSRFSRSTSANAEGIATTLSSSSSTSRSPTAGLATPSAAPSTASVSISSAPSSVRPAGLVVQPPLTSIFVGVGLGSLGVRVHSSRGAGSPAPPAGTSAPPSVRVVQPPVPNRVGSRSLSVARSRLAGCSSSRSPLSHDPRRTGFCFGFCPRSAGGDTDRGGVAHAALLRWVALCFLEIHKGPLASIPTPTGGDGNGCIMLSSPAGSPQSRRRPHLASQPPQVALRPRPKKLLLPASVGNRKGACTLRRCPSPRRGGW
eukprot:m.23088 g.23088  ORF g.23088 m.23088 type:complete len:541 (+) comp5901_c0_seq1:1093-2715(+)